MKKQKKFLADRNQGHWWRGKLDPQEIGEYLDKLPPEERRADNLAKLAEDPKNPLHKHLEWDDTEAARRYRIVQCQQIVTIIYVETEQGPLKEFVSLTAEGQRGYYTPEEIKKSPSLIEQALANFMRDLIFFKQKNDRFRKYFSGLFRSIDEAEKQWSKKNEKGKKGTARKKNRDTKTKASGGSNHSHRRVAAHGK